MKKFFAICLAILFVFSVLPAMAFADTPEGYAPAAPVPALSQGVQQVTATAFENHAVIHFDALPSGEEIIQYRVVGINPNRPQMPVTAVGTASPITLRGMTTGVPYAVRVYALDADGWRAPSAPITAIWAPGQANTISAPRSLQHIPIYAPP